MRYGALLHSIDVLHPGYHTGQVHIRTVQFAVQQYRHPGEGNGKHRVRLVGRCRVIRLHISISPADGGERVDVL